MTNRKRDAKKLMALVNQIEARCMAVDGSVTPTLQEATRDEVIDLMRLTRKRHHNERGQLTEEGLRRAWLEAVAATEGQG